MQRFKSFPVGEFIWDLVCLLGLPALLFGFCRARHSCAPLIRKMSVTCKNDETRSVKIQNYGSVESRSGEKPILRRHLFNTDEDSKNRLFINTGASILISICKFTKNHSCTESYISIPTSTCKFTMLDHPKDVVVEAYMEPKNKCPQYSGNDQLFKIDVESQSLPEKNAELFHHHITRLLFTSRIAILDIQNCVAYILTKMKLLISYYKDRHLDIDILLVNKT